MKIIKNNPQLMNQQGGNNTPEDYNTDSTSTETQRLKILDLLAIRPHNTNELRDNGIMHPAGRISELRDKGYNIQTVKVNQQHSTYKHKNVALYVLHGGKK